MESLTTLVAHGYVITCDAQNRAGRYHLLMRDGRIAAMSENFDYLIALYPDARVVDASNKLIVPGFVNAHIHSESVLLRDTTEGVHFALWDENHAVRLRTAKLIDPANAEHLHSTYLAAYFSHLKSGTTCVGEFPLPVDSRGFKTILNAIGRTDVRAVLALQNWEQINSCGEMTQPRQRFVVNLGPEKDYTVYSFENLVRAARDLKCATLAHVAELRDNVDIVRRNFQKPVLTVLRDFGALQHNTVLVHLNHVTSEDLDLVEGIEGTIVLCARSAAAKQTGVPLLRQLATKGIRLCVGTDWGQFDILTELKFLSQLHLLFPGMPRFSSLDVVRMGTINGAHALGMAGEVGSIEVGKHADLVAFSLGDIRVPPVPLTQTAENMADLLIRHLQTGAITEVMVNGEIVVGQGQLKAMPEEDIVAGFQKTYEQWYPKTGLEEELLGAEQPWRVAGPARPRILPFVPKDRSVLADADGFESGFSTSEKLPQEQNPKQSPAPPQAPPKAPPETPSRLELPKDVQRVFGEDEDL